MAITVTHSKVSTIPDGDDSSLIRPSDWNDDHVLDGTVPVANGGTGADTLTGYVKGNGTSAMTASSTIPNTDITGLGTMSTQNANNVNITGGSISGATVSGYIPTSAEGVPNGVATLDSGGTVPLSQIPASIIGGLNYQGSWNASTNTPTLTSSVGTKGYYYVVSVAGTTNLNGITDWQVGDLAVFNGTVWQKIDNTDAVTSVNGYTGAVVLTYTDVGAFPATATTGTGDVVLATNPTISSPNINVIDFDQTYATTLTAGQLGWDGNNTIGLGMAGGNVVQHIGEDTFYYIKASSAITKGQVIMFTGAVGASGVITGAPATGITNGSYIMGIAAESISLNGFGLVQAFGGLRNINTSGFSDGDVLYYDSSVTGGFTKTYPTSGPIVQVAAVINGGSSGGGSIQVRVSVTQRLTASTGISVSQNGTGSTITNTAPDQTVAIASGTGISVTGTYPNFTVTNTSPSSGGTVTSITAGTGLTGGTITSSGTIAIDSTVTTNSGSQTLTNKTISGASNTLSNIGNSSLTNSSITINGSAISLGGSVSVGTVTSVTGTAPISSSGGATPAISISQASGTTNGYLSSTDWTTFNNKQPAGTYVTSVSATAPITSTGGTTPTLAMPAATGSVNGYLTSTDWTTFNNKAASFTYTSTYIPYGQGTTTPNQASNFTFDGTTQTAPVQRASNGIVCNSRTISASFSIPSGDSAMSAGPITIASGVTVTVPSGGKWVVL